MAYVVGVSEYRNDTPEDLALRQRGFDLYTKYPVLNPEDLAWIMNRNYKATTLEVIYRPQDGAAVAVGVQLPPGRRIDVNLVRNPIIDSRIEATRPLIEITNDCKRLGIANFEMLTDQQNSLEQRTFLEGLGYVTLITREESGRRDFMYLPFDSSMAKNYMTRKMFHKRNNLLSNGAVTFETWDFDLDSVGLAATLSHTTPTTWTDSNANERPVSDMVGLLAAMYAEELRLKRRYWNNKRAIRSIYNDSLLTEEQKITDIMAVTW